MYKLKYKNVCRYINLYKLLNLMFKLKFEAINIDVKKIFWKEKDYTGYKNIQHIFILENTCA